jgi:DNA-binding transcriptional ArsR family regulator
MPPGEVTRALARLQPPPARSTGTSARGRRGDGQARRHHSGGLGDLLGGIAAPKRAIRSTTARRARDDRGHPPTGQVALVALAARSNVTVADLASTTGLGRSTVGKALAKLERAGKGRSYRWRAKGARRAAEKVSCQCRSRPATAMRRREATARSTRLCWTIWRSMRRAVR